MPSALQSVQTELMIEGSLKREKREPPKSSALHAPCLFNAALVKERSHSNSVLLLSATHVHDRFKLHLCAHPLQLSVTWQCGFYLYITTHSSIFQRKSKTPRWSVSRVHRALNAQRPESVTDTVNSGVGVNTCPKLIIIFVAKSKTLNSTAGVMYTCQEFVQ